MEILSIIPARGGSKGIKRKNLKLILDKPLVAYSIQASLESKYITKTVVSTEDNEIAEVSKKYGAQVVERPLELASDEAKTAPVMLQVAEYLQSHENYKPDFVVLLQPTCPIRNDNFIDKAFEFYFENFNSGLCDSCFSAFELGYTHSKWRIFPDNKLEALYNFRLRPRRQEVEEHYKMIQETGAFYALPLDVMKKTKDFIGFNPIAYITPQIIDIDTPEDFKRVEECLKNSV